MNPVRVIEHKRDGLKHTRDEIQFVVDSATGINHGMKPEQLAAWLMAVVWRGLDLEETAWLTEAMAKSGATLDLTGLPKPWVDKHSTGGVGDKTTIALLPMLAACGLTVVKMSGRGLGKTGGTIDKLASIPGFQTSLTPEQLKAQALEIGLALTGQSYSLTPADGTLYALRDVTGTVPSIPLICASVLSKKIAGGAEVISIDLKCGSGAFMETLEDAKELARRMKGVGEILGVKVGVEITDMDQPLGRYAGNLLEVIEAVDTIHGKGEARFTELCLTLCASMLVEAGVCATPSEARARAELCLQDGSAQLKLDQWFAAQGATVKPTELRSLMIPLATSEVIAQSDGWVKRIDAGLVGGAAVDIGAGRRTKEDEVDPQVGIETCAIVGQAVKAGEVILRVFARSDEVANQAAGELQSALEISPQVVNPRELILE